MGLNAPKALRPFLFLFVALSLATARGQTIIWTGGGDGTSWNQRANWNPGRAPTSHDDVLIPAGAGTVLLRGSIARVHALRCDRDLRIEAGLVATGAIDQGPDSHLTLANRELTFGSAVFRGSVVFSGGTVTANGPAVCAGVMELRGGTITGAGDLTLGGSSLFQSGEISGSGKLLVPSGAVLRTVASGGGALLNRPTSIEGILRLSGGSRLDVTPEVEVVIESTGLIDASEGPGLSSIEPSTGSRLAYAKLVLHGRIDARSPGGLGCGLRLESWAGSSIVGGHFGDVKSIAGTVEAAIGEQVRLMGSVTTFEPTARLLCPVGATFQLTLRPGYPEGLLDNLRGDISLESVSHEAVTIPATFAPTNLQLFGQSGPFRIRSDLTVHRLAWWSCPIDLGATVTVNGELPSAGLISGSGRLILAPSATAVCMPSGPGITFENYGTIELSWPFIPAGGTVINQPGGNIRVADGVVYPTSPQERGLLINRGWLNFHVAPRGFHPVFDCYLQNDPGGMVVCGPDDSSATYYFEYVPASVDGLWVCDQNCAVHLDGRGRRQQITVGSGCQIRVAGPLELVGEFVVREGAVISADQLETSVYGYPAPATTCTLFALPSIRRLRVLGKLAVEVPWTLPETYVLGTLMGSADLTVGSTLDLQGDLGGTGGLMVPAGSTMSVLAYYLGHTIAKPVTNRGVVSLGNGTRIVDVEMLNAAGGVLSLAGEISASGTGGIRNLGTVNHAGYLTAPLDNQGTVVVRNGGPYIGSTPQRVGSTLTGGDWRFIGAGALSWPAGVEIEEIGSGARVTLGPGTALPSWNFARTIRRVNGELLLEEGRTLDLRPGASGPVSNGGLLSLASRAVFSVQGAYEQTGVLAVAWEADAARQGQLRADSARLEGSLRIDTFDTPPCGWAFDAVVAPTIEDRLSVISGTELPPGRRWAAYAEDGRLRAGTFALADFNADGLLTVDDYIAYVSCFVGDECPRPGAADFNGDGFLDILDYDAFVEALETGGC